MTNSPTLDEVLGRLAASTGCTIDPDRGVFDQEGVDSFDVVDWLYSLEDDYGWQVSDEVMELLETATIRAMFDHFGNSG